jgi:NAD(P)-dependent dehydrogenase (short-subunit alcohol dehydrogenase family)
MVTPALLEMVGHSEERRAQLGTRVPLGRLAEPEEVADAIRFLASPASSMITGHTLPVDGGFLAQ